jgi:hypothetical protein
MGVRTPGHLRDSRTLTFSDWCGETQAATSEIRFRERIPSLARPQLVRGLVGIVLEFVEQHRRYGSSKDSPRRGKFSRT